MRFPAIRVWVVDDDPGARDGLRALLESWGIDVVAAAGAAEALGAAARGAPDALLVMVAAFSDEVDSVSSIPEMPLRDSSIFTVTPSSISSGEAPG